MDLMIGVAMAVLFAGLNAYAYMTEGFTYDSQFYMQLAVSGGAAFYLLGVQRWEQIKGWFNKEKQPPTVMDYSLQDFEALTYLRSRCCIIGSKKALDLVVELNDLFFQDSANGQMPPDTVATVSNTSKRKA